MGVLIKLSRYPIFYFKFHFIKHYCLPCKSIFFFAETNAEWVLKDVQPKAVKRSQACTLMMPLSLPTWTCKMHAYCWTSELAEGRRRLD
jgi:hypothetical protein